MSNNFKWNDIQFWTTDLPGNQDESKVGSANLLNGSGGIKIARVVTQNLISSHVSFSRANFLRLSLKQCSIIPCDLF